MTLAEIDITSCLGVEHLPDDAEIQYAWYEQAAYLLTQADCGNGAELAAESIDGVGSRTYRARRRNWLAPRAERLLTPLLAARLGALKRG